MMGGGRSLDNDEIAALLDLSYLSDDSRYDMTSSECREYVRLKHLLGVLPSLHNMQQVNAVCVQIGELGECDNIQNFHTLTPLIDECKWSCMCVAMIGGITQENHIEKFNLIARVTRIMRKITFDAVMVDSVVKNAITQICQIGRSTLVTGILGDMFKCNKWHGAFSVSRRILQHLFEVWVLALTQQQQWDHILAYIAATRAGQEIFKYPTRTQAAAGDPTTPSTGASPTSLPPEPNIPCDSAPWMTEEFLKARSMQSDSTRGLRIPWVSVLSYCHHLLDVGDTEKLLMVLPLLLGKSCSDEACVDRVWHRDLFEEKCLDCEEPDCVCHDCKRIDNGVEPIVRPEHVIIRLDMMRTAGKVDTFTECPAGYGLDALLIRFVAHGTPESGLQVDDWLQGLESSSINSQDMLRIIRQVIQHAACQCRAYQLLEICCRIGENCFVCDHGKFAKLIAEEAAASSHSSRSNEENVHTLDAGLGGFVVGDLINSGDYSSASPQRHLAPLNEEAEERIFSSQPLLENPTPYGSYVTLNSPRLVDSGLVSRFVHPAVYSNYQIGIKIPDENVMPELAGRRMTYGGITGESVTSGSIASGSIASGSMANEMYKQRSWIPAMDRQSCMSPGRSAMSPTALMATSSSPLLTSLSNDVPPVEALVNRVSTQMELFHGATDVVISVTEYYLFCVLETYEKLCGVPSRLPGITPVNVVIAPKSLNLSDNLCEALMLSFYLLRPTPVAFHTETQNLLNRFAVYGSPGASGDATKHVYPTLLPVTVAEYFPGPIITYGYANARYVSDDLLRWRSLLFELLVCMCKGTYSRTTLIAPHLSDSLCESFIRVYVSQNNPRAVHLSERFVRRAPRRLIPHLLRAVEAGNLYYVRQLWHKSDLSQDLSAQAIILQYLERIGAQDILKTFIKTYPASLKTINSGFSSTSSFCNDASLHDSCTHGSVDNNSTSDSNRCSCQRGRHGTDYLLEKGDGIQGGDQRRGDDRLDSRNSDPESSPCASPRGNSRAMSRDDSASFDGGVARSAGDPDSNSLPDGRQSCDQVHGGQGALLPQWDLVDELLATKQYEALLVAYCRPTLPGTAANAPQVGAQAYQTVIDAALTAREYVRAFRYFDEMTENFPPDAQTCAQLLRHVHLLQPRLGEAATTASREKLMGYASESDPQMRDCHLFSAIVDALSRIKEIDRLGRVVEEYHQSHPKPTLLATATLMKAYGRCSKREEVLRVWASIEHLNHRDEYIQSCGIDALVSVGELDEALAVWKNCMKTGVKLAEPAQSVLIRGCVTRGRISEALKIYETMVKKQQFPCDITCNYLMHGCTSRRRLEDALACFSDMTKFSSPDTVSYSTIIKGLCDKEKTGLALEMFNQMESKGLKPDIITYNTLMEGFSKAGDRPMVEKLYGQVIENGLQPSCYTLTILIKFYGRIKLLNKVFECLDTMPSAHGFDCDQFVYTSIIAACTWNRRLDLALNVLITMKSKFSISPRTYATVIAGCIRVSAWDTLCEVLCLCLQDECTLNKRLIAKIENLILKGGINIKEATLSQIKLFLTLLAAREKR